MTHLKNNGHKTDNSNKTDPVVSNYDFLNAIFGSEDKAEKPVIVSFSGNPHTGSKAKWNGEGYDPDFSDMPDDHNNFFSLSSFS